MRAWARVLVWLVRGRRFRLRGTGVGPRSGPLLVCANHASTVDPPLIPAFLPRPDSWSMAKAEWFRSPFLRWIFRSYQAFPIVRHSPDHRGLRPAMGFLRAGEPLAVYPE